MKEAICTSNNNSFHAAQKKITVLDGPYVQYENRKMLDFSSLDFLGLSQHPDVKKNAIKHILRLGVGSLPLSLTSHTQVQLEEKCAQLLGRENVRFFPSLTEAHLALSKGNLIFAGSSMEGATYHFSDLSRLETLLEKTKNTTASLKIICAPSDLYDLPALFSLAKSHHVLVCLDDSYTCGIRGKRGFGKGAEHKEADFICGSFQYGCGCPSAYIATTHDKLALLPKSQALSPPLLGVLDSVFNFVPDMEHEREQVSHHVSWLHHKLKERGFEYFSVRYPTTSLFFLSEEEAAKCWALFAANDIFVSHPGPKELSLTMTALHTPDDLDQLACAFKNISATDFALSTQSFTPTP